MGSGAIHYRFQKPSDLAAAVARFRQEHPDSDLQIVRGVAITRDARFAPIASRYQAAVSDLTLNSGPLRSQASQEAALPSTRHALFNERVLPAPSFEPPPFFPAEVRAFYQSAAYQDSLTRDAHPLMKGLGPQDDGRVTLHGTNTELPSPGHIMATDVRRQTHSSFGPRNSELDRHHQLPTHLVGTLKAFPQAATNIGAFYTEGKHFGLHEDPYVFAASGKAQSDSGVRSVSEVPKTQQFAFAFDPRFIDPIAFAEEVRFADAHAASDLREAAYQVATVSTNPLENPRVDPPAPLSPKQAQRIEGQRRNIEERGTNQANNCVTDILWKLFNTPVPNAEGGIPTRTVLTQEDLLRLGMELDSTGGTLSFVPGRDLRPQDLFLYLRWSEQQYLASLERG